MLEAETEFLQKFEQLLFQSIRAALTKGITMNIKVKSDSTGEVLFETDNLDHAVDVVRENASGWDPEVTGVEVLDDDGVTHHTAPSEFEDLVSDGIIG